MQKKIIRRSVPDVAHELDALDPSLQQIYLSRGVTTPNQLTHTLKDLLPFDTLKGLPDALARLTQAFDHQQRVTIVGDFDADGATSCAVAVSALRQMGLKHVAYLVPNRFEYGYGLTPEIVDVAAEGTPDLLITVDNGIASCEGVAHANSKGIDVIVTDHHLPGDTLPDAIAIVNPNQVGCAFPSKHLAGVGVIFYVMMALRAHLRDTGWFADHNIKEPNLAGLLDLVALGTVADVVPLDTNNRLLVAQGIARIRAGQARPGIHALIEVSQRIPAQLRAADLGFSLGPRLNAAGRLEDMSLGIACLLAPTLEKAMPLAMQLHTLNVARRDIEHDMKQQALQQIEALHLDKPNLPKGLCFYQPEWHQGVIGILASRIKDITGRPVVAFARDKDGILKGSARAIPNVHMRDMLDILSKRYPKLILKFGGHAGAAGLSIYEKDLPAFQDAFETLLATHLSDEDCITTVYSDGPLTPPQFTVQFAKTLETGGPWGQAFPEPLFDNTFTVLAQRLVGEKHLKLTLGLPGAEHIEIPAIAFNVDLNHWPNHRIETVHAAYRLDVNYYQGFQNLQLIVEHFE